MLLVKVVSRLPGKPFEDVTQCHRERTNKTAGGVGVSLGTARVLNSDRLHASLSAGLMTYRVLNIGNRESLGYPERSNGIDTFLHYRYVS